MSMLQIENQLWSKYKLIAGLDEAGRGAWAGPVVAAAVVFEPGVVIAGVDDSKKLTAKKREALFEKIKSSCVTYGVGLVDSVRIDEINILEATKQAMLIALSQLKPQPEYLLVDGNMTLQTPILQQYVIDGDALSHSIAAASILAKVTRDRMMVELGKSHPEYRFDSHKGYGTAIHHKALKEHGCLPIHRSSYEPIRKLLNQRPLS